MKPPASSRGRGIRLARGAAEVPVHKTLLVRRPERETDADPRLTGKIQGVFGLLVIRLYRLFRPG